MAVLVSLVGFGAANASAAELTPCPAGGQSSSAAVAAPVALASPARIADAGATVKIDGEANLVPGGKIGKALRRAKVKQRLIRPANGATGRPTYPVSDVTYSGGSSRVTLGGGLRLVGKGKRGLEFRSIAVSVKGTRVAVNARFAGGIKRLFNVKGAELRRIEESGELYLQSGSARLSVAASKAIRKRFGRKATKTLSPGARWGVLDVYARRQLVAPPTDPEGEVPDPAPDPDRPATAVDLTGGSIDWRVRDSFIRYVNAGTGASAIDGSVPGPPEVVDGAVPLVYRFGFPFSSGWIDEAAQNRLVKGSGGVAFRYCAHGINFHVNDPEIELNGDLSRMIFRVEGTDGTAFPSTRVVMVGLRLNQAESVTTNGKTTTIKNIPGFIPEGSSGIFADFYLPGSEFGSLTVSYTVP